MEFCGKWNRASPFFNLLSFILLFSLIFFLSYIIFLFPFIPCILRHNFRIQGRRTEDQLMLHSFVFSISCNFWKNSTKIKHLFCVLHILVGIPLHVPRVLLMLWKCEHHFPFFTATPVYYNKPISATFHAFSAAPHMLWLNLLYCGTQLYIINKSSDSSTAFDSL